jgi:amino acid adenylation domain-containing protein
MVDAWSSSILNRELCQLYHQPDAVLPPLEISFRDYVMAETALRDTDLYRRSQDYWWKRLPTLPPAPELPLAKDPSLITSPRFTRRSTRFEPQAWTSLKRLAARAGLTASGPLLTAFADVLKVWSKSPRFTINLTLFNRLPLHPQVNDIVGDMTSLTLLAVDDSAGDAFAERARRLQKQLWGDLDHRFVSGVEVMRELAKRQRNMLGGVMPVVFTSIIGQQSSNSLTAPLDKIVYGITQTPQVWLDSLISEEAESLIICWDAVEELFPEGLLDDMFDSYCRSLRRLADDEDAWQEAWPETACKLVPVRELEQRRVVNATETAVTDRLLHTLFAEQVPQRQQQAAVITPNRSVTYGELYRCSNRIGRWLRGNGAQRNTLVAVVMEKGWEQVAGALGVLASGAAYLPIDAGLPKDRLWHLLQHGEARFILTQPQFDKKLEWPDRIKRLTIDEGHLAGLNDHPLDPVQTQEDLAYVIYTSGSTGLPKGVMIDHRGAVNTLLDLNRRFSVRSQDRVLALSSLSFDLSVYDIFGILAAGGTMVIPDAAGLRDPAHWVGLAARHRVTLWNSVPALMQMLVEYLEGCGQSLPEALRLVLMSGDWIPVALPDRIRALNDKIAIFSLGGATEASIWSIIYPIEKVNPSWKSIPYGQPMENQTFHVLNEVLEPCPVWVPGQLYIGGIGLAKGYWRDDEKTRASFIKHPRTGERLYRTGDQGRYLSDGNIEFLGRDDFQVKIQGYRIELGEIETILAQHPGVRTSVVTASSATTGNKRLVAYVVPERHLQASGFHEHKNSPQIDLGVTNGSRASQEVLRDPLERLHFKLTKPGMRHDDGRASIQLTRPEVTERFLEPYISRRSYRRFADGWVPFERFGDLLSSLYAVEIDGTPFPKYRYASAGGLYPVQTYLYIKPDRVEGVGGGTYFYRAATHSLFPLSLNSQIHSTDFHGAEAIFDQSSFALFFVAQLSSIVPMYGELARDFCVIEAGSMCQLLETLAPSYQIGLCQIGGLDFQPIRHLFDLEQSHSYLHCLLGGPVAVDQNEHQAFVEEMSAYSHLLRHLEEQSGERKKVVHMDLATPMMAQHAALSQSDNGIADELRHFLQGKLPDYMIPANFVVLDKLPLSSNGKVDRKALPEPTSSDSDLAMAYAAPLDGLEGAIADLWREVLQVERVGVQENFFDVGGNSLHIVQMHAKIRERLGREIPIVELFRYTTIESLAKYLSQNRNDATPPQQGVKRAQMRRASSNRRQPASQQNAEIDE